MSPIQEMAQNFAERCAPKGYTGHTISICSTCGHMEWSCSSNDRVGVTIEPLGIYRPCEHCRDVYSRNPELVNWVLNVMVMAKLNHESETVPCASP